MPPSSSQGEAKVPRWLLVLSGFIACVVIVFLIILPLIMKTDYGNSYFVMVDAGSSASKVYLYSWASGASSRSTPVVIKQEFFRRSRYDGIASYFDTPTVATKEIVAILKDNILNDADKSPITIPSDQRATTPIYMAATAGMRLLEARDPVASQNVMNSVRTELSRLGLLVRNSTKQMRIISGDEEALAGWISINYLSQTLQKSSVSDRKSQEGTIGALDMGGASTQISFVTKDPVGFNASMIRLYDRTFRLYQHSFLCFGKIEALRQLYSHLWKNAGYPVKSSYLKNPCAYKGYTVKVRSNEFLVKPCFTNPENRPLPDESVEFMMEGTGDPKQCRQLMKLLFLRKECKHKRCSFEGIYQPPLSPGKFAAFSGYYFTMRFFNVTKTHPSRQAYRNLLKSFCQRPWDSVKNQYSSMIPTIFLSGYCFDGIYIDEVLSHLGFNETRWNDISFVGKIENRKTSWTLGFVLKESAMVPPGIRSDSIPQPLFVGLMILCILVLILSIVVFIIFSWSRWVESSYSQASTEEKA